MRRLTTIGLILCVALVIGCGCRGEANPVVPGPVQRRILRLKPRLAYAPTRWRRLSLLDWQNIPENVRDHVRQQGALGRFARRPAAERPVPGRDGEELPARRQQGVLVAHRGRAKGLALCRRPEGRQVRSYVESTARDAVRGRRPWAGRRLGQARRRLTRFARRDAGALFAHKAGVAAGSTVRATRRRRNAGLPRSREGGAPPPRWGRPAASVLTADRQCQSSARSDRRSRRYACCASEMSARSRAHAAASAGANLSGALQPANLTAVDRSAPEATEGSASSAT